jgi:hypothetical protein
MGGLKNRSGCRGGNRHFAVAGNRTLVVKSTADHSRPANACNSLSDRPHRQDSLNERTVLAAASPVTAANGPEFNRAEIFRVLSEFPLFLVLIIFTVTTPPTRKFEKVGTSSMLCVSYLLLGL